MWKLWITDSGQSKPVYLAFYKKRPLLVRSYLNPKHLKRVWIKWGLYLSFYQNTVLFGEALLIGI